MTKDSPHTRSCPSMRDLLIRVMNVADLREAGYKARAHGDIINKDAADSIVAMLPEIRAVLSATGALSETAPCKETLAAIDDEPELPGDMPDEMWEAIRNDRDAVQQAMKIAVRQTKEGIRERYLASVAKR